MREETNLKPVLHVENADDLPQGWTVVRLERICYPPQYGWTTSAARNTTGLRLLRTTDISAGWIDWPSVPTCNDEPADPEKYLLKSGDIVVSRAGSVGISHLIENPPKSVFASYLIRFRPLEPISARFISYYLRSPQYWSDIADESAGVAIPNVNASKLKRLEIPLPPLAEQNRIASKIDELLANLDAAGERLGTVLKILRGFRQSVVAAACSGRLTEDWRRQNDTQIPVAGLDENWPDLPEEWRSATVESVCSEVVDCPHSTPKWANAGVVCLRTTNFRPGHLDVSDVRYVSNSTYKERTSRIEPRFGDVVYSREGGILGIACQIPSGLKACLGQRMMLMRANSKVYSATFLMHVLNSPFISGKVAELTGGSASPHLNVGDIKKFAVPLPSIEEQREIVTRIGVLFKLARKIEERVEVATKRAERLSQSIFFKAFRGGLVRTEAELALDENREYESASALLERIKRDRAESVSTHNGRAKQIRNTRTGKANTLSSAAIKSDSKGR